MTAISDFVVGYRVVVERPITIADLDRFCELSLDTSPIHADAMEARRRGFAGRVAHGALISAFVSAVIGTQLPGEDGVMQSIIMQFRKPVIPPETLTIIAEIAAISAAVGQLRICIKVIRNSDREVAATGEVRSIVRVGIPK